MVPSAHYSRDCTLESNIHPAPSNPEIRFLQYDNCPMFERAGTLSKRKSGCLRKLTKILVPAYNRVKHGSRKKAKQTARNEQA
jgi:hypothetical protein